MSVRPFAEVFAATLAIVVAHLATVAGCTQAGCPAGYVRSADLCVPLGDDGGGADAARGASVQPSITLVITPDYLVLHAGETRTIRLTATSVGVTSPYRVELNGLPTGVTGTSLVTVDPTMPAMFTLSLTADASAAPTRANATVMPSGTAAGLATPVALSIQVAGRAGSAAQPPVTLWTATSTSIGRYAGCLLVDGAAIWAALETFDASLVSDGDHLLRIAVDGTVLAERSVYPTAAELGVSATFDQHSTSALCSPRSGGGVLLGGSLTDLSMAYAPWVAAIDATGSRVGSHTIGSTIPPASRSGCNAVSFEGDLIAGCTDSNVRRYGADATVVPSFGVGGTVLVSGNFAGVDDTGALLVDSAPGIARYRTDGRAELDPAFAGDGFLNFVDPDPTRTFAVAGSFLTARGAFYAYGSSEPTASPGTARDGLLWRIHNDGSIDSTFAGGFVRFSAAYTSDLRPIQVLSDDSLLVAVTEYDMAGTTMTTRLQHMTSHGERNPFGATGDGVPLRALFAVAADQRTGRVYVIDTDGAGRDLFFQVFWL